MPARHQEKGRFTGTKEGLPGDAAYTKSGHRGHTSARTERFYTFRQENSRKKTAFTLEG